MADAFRGLTLRIGADTRPLQSAISSISRSASMAQKQLNRMDKALKFDGTNVAAMRQKIDLLGDKAAHSARSITKIKTAMRQAVEASDGFDLKKVANQTTKAYSEAQKLKAEYNHINAELERIYLATSNSAQKMEKFKDVNEAVKYVKMLREQMKGTGDSAKWAEEQFDKFLNDAAKSSKICEQFGLMKGDAAGLKTQLEKLAEAQVKVNSKYEKMKTISGYRAAQQEVIAYEAKIRKASAQAAKLATEMHKLGTGGHLAKSISQIELLGNASEKAVASARQMASAYKSVPNSVEAFRNKTLAAKGATVMLDEEIRAIEGALRKIEADPAFDKQAAASEKAYSKAMKVEQEYAELKGALTMAEEKADAFNDKLRQMRSDNVEETSEKFKKAKASAQAAEEEVRELKSRLDSLDDSHAMAALTVQARELSERLTMAKARAAELRTEMGVLKALSSFGGGMRNFGFGMMASVTPYAMMLGRYMVQAAEDTDAAYRDMRKTVNGTEEDFQALLDSAIEFSTTHITSAEQMLEIEAIGGQLGVQVENLEAFAHTVSNLDIATNMESEDIATDLGKMASVMGLSTDEYDRFGDALVRLGNNMPAMESDIMTVTTRMMGMGEAVGLSADQMLAWSTAATTTGQKPYAAGSSLSRFMKYLNTAVAENGEALEKWSAIAGVSSEEFSKAFREDASSAMYSVVEGLGSIQKSGGDVSGTLIDLGINGVQDTQLLLGLASQMANATEESNILADSLMLANDAFNGDPSVYKGKIEQAGDAMREAEAKSEGFSGAMGKLRNQAKAALIELSEGATPLVEKLSSVFEKLAKAFESMPDGMKTAIVEMIGFAAAIGPVSVGLGTSLQMLGRMATLGKSASGGIMTLGLSIAGLGKAGGTLEKLGLAIAGIAGPGGILAAAGVVGVGALAYGIYDAYKKTKQFEKATTGAVDAAKRLAGLGGDGSSLDEYAKTAETSAKSLDQLRESIAKTTDAQNERAEAAEQDIGKLAAAKEIIDKYANTDLSGNVQAQGELKTAVELFNEVSGEQWQVIDLVNGKLADERGELLDTADAIDEYIDKYMDKVKTEAMTETLSELWQNESDAFVSYMKQLEAAEEYHEKYKDEIDAQEGRDSVGGKTAHAQDYEDMLAEAEKARQIYEDQSEAARLLESQLGSLMAATESAGASVASMVKGSAPLIDLESAGLLDLDVFGTAVQEAGITGKEFGDLSNEQVRDMAAAWISSGGDITAALDAVGLEQRTLAEQYRSEMQDAQESTDAWAAALETTGMKEDELAQGLRDAGISAAEFASVGASSFAALYAAADGNLGMVRTEMDVLNAAGLDLGEVKLNDEGLLQVGEQVVKIKDDTATIDDQEFKITASGIEEVQEQVEDTASDVESLDGESADVDIDADSSDFDDTAEDVEEYMDALSDGSVDIQISANEDASIQNFLDLIDKLQSLGSIGVETSISVDASGIDEAMTAWDSLGDKLSGGMKGSVSVDAKSIDDAVTKAGNLKTAIKDIPDRGVYVSVIGGALSTVNSLQDALDNLTTYKKITIETEKVSKSKTATGGIVPGYAAGGMLPAHADGALNGIVTRAMLTNIGWVGEAGAEAVLNWGTGGAVVPLTNTRYMKPIASAIASEMGGTFGGPTVNVSVDWRAGDDANAVATRIANAVSRKLAMEG